MSDALRWTGAEGTKLRDEVFGRLQAGKRLDGLGLGEVDGRVDLRGFRMPEHKGIEDVRLAGLDVGGALINTLEG